MILFISFNSFSKKSDVYNKNEVYTKSEVENLLKSSCKYIQFEGNTYFGQTSNTICENINMEPKFLVIRQVVDVMSQGAVTYRDINYYVGDPTVLNTDASSVFSKPLGIAEDGSEIYGRPDGGHTGQTNTLAYGLLCCK